MRVVLDLLVAQSMPDLLETWRSAMPDHLFETFDPFMSPAGVTHALAGLRPEVLLVDPSWLKISPLLRRLVTESGNDSARLVIGARHIDDILRFRTADHGFFDILDVGRPPDEVAASVGRIGEGQSALDSDPIWLRVPHPPTPADMSLGPRDQTDLDILELICVGSRDSDIAEIVALSLQRVKNRISAMLDRTGLENRTQLAWQFTNQQLVASMLDNIQYELDREGTRRT